MPEVIATPVPSSTRRQQAGFFARLQPQGSGGCIGCAGGNCSACGRNSGTFLDFMKLDLRSPQPKTEIPASGAATKEQPAAKPGAQQSLQMAIVPVPNAPAVAPQEQTRQNPLENAMLPLPVAGDMPQKYAIILHEIVSSQPPQKDSAQAPAAEKPESPAFLHANNAVGPAATANAALYAADAFQPAPSHLPVSPNAGKSIVVLYAPDFLKPVQASPGGASRHKPPQEIPSNPQANAPARFFAPAPGRIVPIGSESARHSAGFYKKPASGKKTDSNATDFQWSLAPPFFGGKPAPRADYEPDGASFAKNKQAPKRYEAQSPPTALPNFHHANSNGNAAKEGNTFANEDSAGGNHAGSLPKSGGQPPATKSSAKSGRKAEEKRARDAERRARETCITLGFDFDGILSDSKGGFNPFAGSGKPAARDAYWHGQLRPDKNGRLPAQKARYLSLYKKLLAFLQAHPNLNNKKRRRLLALMDLCLAIAS